MSNIAEQLQAALAGRYTIERELGAGGMATVYLAHDLKHDRNVAIKVLHPDLGAALGAERFLSEIRTTARLQHPHILPLLAIGLFTDAADDIWVKRLPNGPLSRVSYDPSPEARPRWTRDGRALTFVSGRRGEGVFRHRADGLGSDSLLVKGPIDEAVLSPDGAWLVLRTGSIGSVSGGRDITGVRLGADTARVPLIVTPFDEEAIALSPDGKWIAYQSDETGRTEVFVRSFPNTSTFKHYGVERGRRRAALVARRARIVLRERKEGHDDGARDRGRPYLRQPAGAAVSRDG